jgi:4a-hydroxytetrahydrobiopterin dehydratase
MATVALSDAQITDGLQGLAGWEREGDTLVKTFKLPTYAAGLLFASMVGAIAEGHDHHPDMTIGYKTVRVSFSTHDAGNKISQKDLTLATAIEALPYPKK